MIIYGFRTRERSVGGGEFPCPCCKFQRSYSEVESRRWFALYFIPLFPVYYQGRHVQCHACGQTFGLEVLQIATPFQPTQGAMPLAVLAQSPLHATAQGVMAPPVMDHGQPYAGAGKPGSTTHYQYTPPPTSGLGIVSMVLGILSPFFFLACGASIFTAIGAVICGHLSLLKKADESGRTPSRGAAITGLVLGYMFLLLSPIPIYFAYRIYSADPSESRQLAQGGPREMRAQTGDRLLHEMEMKVISDSGGAAHGNNEQAKQLAQAFSDSLNRVREENFTGGNKKGIKLTGGKFIVCCELRGNSCAFLVHVPEFRNFEKDAKAGLAELAWLSAQETAIKQIGPQGKLAVGLKGVVLYGAVMVGECGEEPAFLDVDEVAKKDPLIAFLDLAQKEEELIAADTESPSAEANAPLKPVAPPVVAQAPFSPPMTPAPGNTPPGNVPPGNTPPEGFPLAESPLFGTPPGVPAPSGGGFGIPGGGVTGPGGDAGAGMRGLAGRPDGGRTPPGMDREFKPSGLPAPKVTMLEPIAIAQGGITSKGMTFSPDNKYLATQVDMNVVIFDLKDRKLKAANQWTIELFGVGAMLFSENSKRLFVGGGSGVVQLWEFHPRGSLQPKASLNKQEGAISVFAAREDASFIVGGGSGGNLFWQQIKSNKPGALRQVKALQIDIKDIYLPETGLDFWAVDGLELVQVDMKSAEVKSKIRLEGVYSFDVKFSDDGKYVATSFVDELHVLDSKTGQIAYRHRAPEPLENEVEWIPGQNRILVSLSNGGVAIFDPEKGYITQFPIGPVNTHVESICASQAGSMIAITVRSGREIYLASIEKPTTN